MQYKEIKCRLGIIGFPADWIVVNYKDPSTSNHPYVIDVRNGDKYDASHFVCFGDSYPAYITDDEQKKIEAICVQADPSFQEIIDKEIRCAPDWTFAKPHYINRAGNDCTAEEYRDAPTIGIFDLSNRTPDEVLPYGCYVK